MTLFYWAVSAMLAIFAVTFVRLGLRQWRGVGRPPSYWLRGGPMDAESRAAYDRGALALGLACTFMTILCVDGALAGVSFGRGTALGPVWFSIAATAIVGMLIFIGMFTTIMYFNWPQLLVPPGLRADLGAIAGRRRRRREHQRMM